MAPCIICYKSVTHTPLSSDVASSVTNPKIQTFPDAAAKRKTLIEFLNLINNRNGILPQNDETSHSPLENVINAGFLSCEDCSRYMWYFCDLQKKLKIVQGGLMLQLLYLDRKILNAGKEESKLEQFLESANEQDGWSLFNQIIQFRNELVPKSKQCLQGTTLPFLEKINTATESAPNSHPVSTPSPQTGHETPSSSTAKNNGNCRGGDEPKTSGTLMVTLQEQSEERIDVDSRDDNSTSNLLADDLDEIVAAVELGEVEFSPEFIKYMEDPTENMGTVVESLNTKDLPPAPTPAEAPKPIPEPGRMRRASEIMAGWRTGKIGIKEIKVYKRAPNPNGAHSSNQKLPGKCIRLRLEGEVDPESTAQFTHARGSTEEVSQLPGSSSDWIQLPIESATLLKALFKCSFCPLHFLSPEYQCSHSEACKSKNNPGASNNSGMQTYSHVAGTSTAMPTEEFCISHTSVCDEDLNLGVDAFQDPNQRVGVGVSHPFGNGGSVVSNASIDNGAGNRDADSSTEANGVAMEIGEYRVSSDSGGPKIP